MLTNRPSRKLTIQAMDPETQTAKSCQCVLSNATAKHLYANWKENAWETTGSCLHKSTQLLALHFNYFTTIDVTSCKCAMVAQMLLHFGFFPTAPSQPHMAVSIKLLAFYQALFEWLCDVINALASTLYTHYVWHGEQQSRNSSNTAWDLPFSGTVEPLIIHAPLV
ncbi:hypothetical protein J3R82DRAFT_6234 [Butyriboletus roseoflavus]|nr:hypothetical protein J3R82DRAFT_6234 [Butyriboletus roseoflavus]